LPNQSVHLTPEAGSFFAYAISEQNFSFAKSSLASGAGDFYVSFYSIMSKVYLRPEKIVGQFGDYMLIQNDLDVAYSYLKTIHDMADEQLLANGPVVRALWISSVITYTKCFTSSGPGRSGLDKKNWVDKEFLLAHKKMLDWRNKFIAHREHRVFEDIKVFIELDLSTERKGPSRFSQSRVERKVNNRLL